PRPNRTRVSLRPERPQLLARDDLEPERARVVEVARGEQRPAHPGLYRSRRLDQALLDGAPERRSVEVPLVEVLVPRVRVRVELDERHLPVPAREGAELRERDRVVAAEDEREDTGVDERSESSLDPLVRALGVPWS